MHLQQKFFPTPFGHPIQETKTNLADAHLDVKRMPKKG
jgi:hypothetical protein